MLPRSLLILGAAAAASTANAAYTLVDNYDRSNFFDSFTFFTDKDPTNGFVQYTTPQVANNRGLAGYAGNQIYLGVDHTTQNPASGRASVRVTSKKAYTRGLFVADITHMPEGCGVWPAFWTFGPNWPSSGEIDIIEGVNSQATNSLTLHTGPGCSVTNTGSLGSTKFVAGGSTDCGHAGGFSGCSQATADSRTYGAGFNAAGGAVVAMEWTAEAIQMWQFSRGSPQASQALSPNPVPSSWGPPLARFAGCDFDAHFRDHQVVFNTDLCGDWAGQVWGQDATCGKLAPTCQQYVANNPGAFADAYWMINAVKVFQSS
ncbi:uncharacterized protein E0L32_003452 [Thyridium curvatum]|uniref:endo-1,3(4)-beta-glucanase n=1 Tax=Thyridium curvatum TaxID=1093900 RepID=A0A507BJS6_9PEZI|nr:uncharacterized protein E0L32_003452 [Thyridium curvatum]TPX16890.1 hypothetical protein E0L32_003452 [Thyridium curvatum]